MYSTTVPNVFHNRPSPPHPQTGTFRVGVGLASGRGEGGGGRVPVISPTASVLCISPPVIVILYGKPLALFQKHLSGKTRSPSTIAVEFQPYHKRPKGEPLDARRESAMNILFQMLDKKKVQNHHPKIPFVYRPLLR